MAARAHYLHFFKDIKDVIRTQSNNEDGAFCKDSEWRKAVNCFLKRLHLGCLPVSWIFIDLNMFKKCPKKLKIPFLISWIFFSMCINFLGQNFCQMKTRYRDRNHLK